MRIEPDSIRKCCWLQQGVDISDWMFVMSLTMLAGVFFASAEIKSLSFLQHFQDCDFLIDSKKTKSRASVL